jgi:hypothetical protein
MTCHECETWHAYPVYPGWETWTWHVYPGWETWTWHVYPAWETWICSGGILNHRHLCLAQHEYHGL